MSEHTKAPKRTDQKALVATTGNPGDRCSHGIRWAEECPECDEVWEQMTATKKEKDQAQRISELEQQRDELLAALEHIVEYWNGDPNTMAMVDALNHIEDVALTAIAKVKGQP